MQRTVFKAYLQLAGNDYHELPPGGAMIIGEILNRGFAESYIGGGLRLGPLRGLGQVYVLDFGNALAVGE